MGADTTLGKDKGFTHLHLHTQYSLLDGAIRMEDLAPSIEERGMDSVAVTDHGNMYGAVDFYKRANKQKIKPIFGCEAYVASGDRMDKTKRDSAIAYLASETVLIGEIRAAIATALNVKQALLQMGHLAMRLGANRAPVYGGGKDDRVVDKGEALHGAAFSTEKGGLYNGEYTASGKLELAGQKTLKERIIAMLDEVDRSLKDELALSQAKAKENTATMKAEHDANVKTSAATLKARLAELQAEVDRTALSLSRSF